jgi:uncharacterized protein YbcV (DUF1398 family)
VLPVNDASDREKVVEHLGLHELGRTSYLEMSKGLADSGVEKWNVDTNAMTLGYEKIASVTSSRPCLELTHGLRGSATRLGASPCS